MFLLFSVAKKISFFKARADAWTQQLEDELQSLKLQIEAASEVNLTITGDNASLLNGHWAVKAGI